MHENSHWPETSRLKTGKTVTIFKVQSGFDIGDFLIGAAEYVKNIQ
jgi:hypothetical protein